MRRDLQDVFETLRWDSRPQYPRSGAGSTLEATEQLRLALPDVFKRYKVSRFLDAPCGDWHWMQHVDLGKTRYIGGDISRELIDEIKQEHTGKNRKFIHLDITSDPLPKADMMLCRDCLFHLTWEMRWAFLENFANSEISYLMLTMYHIAKNEDLQKDGDFAQFNPTVEPFNFEQPLEMIHEAARVNLDPAFVATPRGSWQRSLGIWNREQIERVLENRKS